MAITLSAPGRERPSSQRLTWHSEARQSAAMSMASHPSAFAALRNAVLISMPGV